MGKNLQFYYDEDLVVGIKDYIAVEDIKKKDWMDMLYDGLLNYVSQSNKMITSISKKRKGLDLPIVNKGIQKTITLKIADINNAEVKHDSKWEGVGSKRILKIGDLLYNDLEKNYRFNVAVNTAAGDSDFKSFEEMIEEVLVEEGNKLSNQAHDKALKKEQEELEKEKSKEDEPEKEQ